METIKAFVRPDNTATIVCPVCATVKQISAKPYRHKKQTLNIRCSCDTTFTVQLEFRQQYRKQTYLPGTYRMVDSPGINEEDIEILNISRIGIGFTVSGPHKLKENQTVQLEFSLNNKKLTKRAVIQAVNNNYIGCHFVDQELYEKTLGFFLRC